jgi:amidase
MYRRSFLQLCCASLSSLTIKQAAAAGKAKSTGIANKIINNELCSYQARELAELIQTKELSISEMLYAHLALIERVNPVVNAICTLVPEQAIETAKAMDQALAKGHLPGPLWGLPIAIKDLTLTKGIRTTFGSAIYKDFVPDQDALFVQRLKKAGAIIIGKTNTPEFGAGSHTFNSVFGITRNPYDISKICGGSSGGAAVSLATGMLPIADGSDLAGSLRNPAAYCNIVGFRPSPGRVPDWPSRIAETPLPVSGPMGRTVKDVAWLLSVMAGPDKRVSLSIQEPGSKFLQPLEKDFTGTSIAWTPDLGRYPVDPVVIDVCKKSLSAFHDIGCHVDEAHPDLSTADHIFQTMRANMFATLAKTDYEKHRDKMKETVIWNIEKGLQQTEEDVINAEKQRLALVVQTAKFFEQYDFLVLPAVQVPPFPVETEWVREINGTKMETYIDWMAICSAITVTGLPAISVPCGFTPDGLPIGLQIVGPPRGDFELLQIAHAFEQATLFGKQKPLILKKV